MLPCLALEFIFPGVLHFGLRSSPVALNFILLETKLIRDDPSVDDNVMNPVLFPLGYIFSPRGYYFMELLSYVA